MRLTLTPLTVGDAEGMLAVYADERMYTFTGGEPPDLAWLRARYDHLVVGWNHDRTQRWANWIVRRADRPEPVGTIQATIGADRSWAALAWEVGVEHWGEGIASEAAQAVVYWLREHGVARMTASIHPDHAASMAVARRIGLSATSALDDSEVVWALDVQ